MLYFYGKIIRPLSRILKVSRCSIKSIYYDYKDVRDMFDNFDIKTKYYIFKNYNDKIKFDVKNCTCLPENVFYLIYYYYKDEIFNISELSNMFNITKDNLRRILKGKIKQNIYNQFENNNVSIEKIKILRYLNKVFYDNPVPSLERNFFERSND